MAFPVQVPLLSKYLVEVVLALTVGALLAPLVDPVTSESPGALEFVGGFPLETPGIAAMSRRLLLVLELFLSAILFFSA